MHHLTNRFVDYCEQNLEFEDSIQYPYQSLSVCIIDCVYSLRAKYYSMTLPVVERYATHYLDGNKNKPGDTVSLFIQHIEEVGSPQKFADTVLKNHQKLGGKSCIPKEDICYQLAKYLKYLHIETIEDFQNFESQELLEIVIKSVKGMGDAGVNYLFMLAGDPNRCKPDVHILRCVKEACGRNVSNEECQTLFFETVNQLNKKHPNLNLTVRSLDGIIWRKFQSKQ